MRPFKVFLTFFFALIIAPGLLSAQGIQFKELNEKLTYDRAPVESVNGVIASYAPALENATPAVVTITSKTDPVVRGRGNIDPREEMLRQLLGLGRGDRVPEQSGLGSGVIISADGYILTNNHVVGGADRITVSLADSRKEYEARVIGADKDTDVALIKIDAQNLKPIRIGDSSNIKVGDVVLAVGNPLGLRQTVSHGIVSALGRRSLGITEGGYENFIQTDASINVGNSGGALIDAEGRLIGLNTAIKTAGYSRGNIGIAFAIPSNMALNVVRKLLDGGGVVRRGFLGVGLEEIDAEMAAALGRDNLKGAIITDVNAGTPADDAGLKPGDLIVEFNNRRVDDPAQLRLDISSQDPGTEVDFKLIRKGKERNISVVLGDKEELLARISGRAPRGIGGGNRGQLPPPVKDNRFLEGVVIKDLDRNLRGALRIDNSVRGVFVESVDQGTDAAGAGLQAGQIITQVDQQNVTSVDEAEGIMENFDGQLLLLQVYRDGRRSILAIPMN